MNKDGLKLYPFCFPDEIWIITCECGAGSPKESKSKEGAKRIWNRRRLS